MRPDGDPVSRRVRPFTQSDVTTAIKGAVKAGVKHGRVELPGEISVFFFAGEPAGGEPDVGAPPTDRNEWDDV